MEADIERLRSENVSLADELAQCQADKEFVWSLWKRLQVASPDITQAVAMIVDREKEKAEIKDAKILEILRTKDDTIENLQSLIQTQDSEQSKLVTKNKELEDEVNRLKLELDNLQFNCNQLQNKIMSLDGKEKDQLGMLQALDAERQDLNEKISEQIIQLTRLRNENDEYRTTATRLEETKQLLERERRDIDDRLNRITKEYEDYRRKNKNVEQQLEKWKHEYSLKEQDLEQLRRELSDVWASSRKTTEHATHQADLIQQLQNLQQDTHQVLQNQETGYQQELSTLQQANTELKSQMKDSKSMENELRQQLREYQEHVEEQQGLIADLERQLEFATENKYTQAALSSSKNQETQLPGYESDDIEIYFKVQSLQTENSVLKERLREKNKIIERFESSAQNKRRTASPSHRCTKRDPSPNVCKDGSNKKDLSQELQQTKELLTLKTAEMQSLESAHKKRLERLRSLQKNYRLIREQLKTLEAGSQKKKPQKIERASPKDLQREDTDRVWNELTFYKTENKKLVVERMNMEEELDTLRVQSSQDAACIHELRVCLQQEKQDLQQLLEEHEISEKMQKREQQRQHIAEISAHKVAELQTQIEAVQQEKRVLEEAQRAWHSQSRALKMEMNQVKRECAEQRIVIANQKLDVSRLQIELKRQRKRANKVRALKKNRQAQTQRTLLLGQKDDGDDLHDEEWEEVTESGEEPDNTASTMETSQSLGEMIVQTARKCLGRPFTSSKARKTMRNDRRTKQLPSEVSTSFDSDQQTPQSVLTSDRATSPITIRCTEKASKRGGLVRSGGNREMSSSRQLRSVRQRLVSVQQQMAIIRDSRDCSVKALQSARDKCNQFEQDLSFANKQIKMNKDTIRRLQCDLERLQGEKQQLEQQVIDTAETSTSHTTDDQLLQNEIKQLQSRIKICSTEMSKQSAVNKSLQSEKSELEGKLSEKQERISHLERDLNQKRSLVEDYRIKLRLSQENAQRDNVLLEEYEAKIQHLTESRDRAKTYSESLKKQLSVISKERQDSAEKMIKLNTELDKKTQALTELQHKASDLQTTLSEVEYAAQKQLHGLASQSEVAMDTAQTKIIGLSGAVEEYHKLFQSLSHAISQDVQQARTHVHQQKKKTKHTRAVPISHHNALKTAESLACSILNISHNDLDELMNADSADDEQGDNYLKSELKRDAKWAKKLEKTINTQTKFAMPVMELLLERIDERVRLVQQLHQ